MYIRYMLYIYIYMYMYIYVFLSVTSNQSTNKTCDIHVKSSSKLDTLLHRPHRKILLALSTEVITLGNAYLQRRYYQVFFEV